MKPDISEFSYGYAVTSELVHSRGVTLAGAPVFPSLIREGNLGYDLELPIIGGPVFLQFKLSDYMVGGLAKGTDKMGIPHYRMHLRSLKHSKQHNLLLALEGKGQQVFYSAPEFHKPVELNGAYLKREILQRSAFFRPKAIGVLNDEEHFVCFTAGSRHGYRYSSEPTKIDRERFDDVINILSAQVIDEDTRKLPARDYLHKIADDMVSEWTRSTKTSPQDLPLIPQLREIMGPLEYLGWLAQSLFDCTVFVKLSRPYA